MADEKNYGSMSLAEIREIAKQKGIKSISGKHKQELIDILTKMEQDEAIVRKGTRQSRYKERPHRITPQTVVPEQTEVPEQISEQPGRPVQAKTEAPEQISEQSGRPVQAKTEAPEQISEQLGRPVQAKTEAPEQISEQLGRPVQAKMAVPAKMQGQLRRPAQVRMPGQQRRPVQAHMQVQPQVQAQIPVQQQSQMPEQSRKYLQPNIQNTNNDDERSLFVKAPGDIDKEGILEIVPDAGYGFLRCSNFLSGDQDVYVSSVMLHKTGMRNGDMVKGIARMRNTGEKYGALAYVLSINGMSVAEVRNRPKFENLTPIFPNERIHLETPGCSPAMRMVDLICPIGKGQRGMIVSQPKAGKTTLLKQIANAIKINHPEMHILILLIDERPEEVTDMHESIQGDNVEIIDSTFDELPENHKKVSEMVIDRARRLVEQKRDVIILLDSITRLARAYNLIVAPSGRTLSGGLDPAALNPPKRFFGAARNMREGGSLTILATALVETGSRMDDVVYEEFKGTGNMELVLNRNLSERRIFPAMDFAKSSTRREDLLLTSDEAEASLLIRRAVLGNKSDEAIEKIIALFTHTKTNKELVELVRQRRGV